MANRFEGEEELALEEELHEVMHESGETGEGEGILGAIGNVLGGLPGEEELHEDEFRQLHKLPELHEFHQAESWNPVSIFGKIGRLIQRAASPCRFAAVNADLQS